MCSACLLHSMACFDSSVHPQSQCQCLQYNRVSTQLCMLSKCCNWTCQGREAYLVVNSDQDMDLLQISTDACSLILMLAPLSMKTKNIPDNAVHCMAPTSKQLVQLSGQSQSPFDT